MPTDAITADSSAATPEAPATPEPLPIEKWDSTQRSEWLRTGSTPEVKPPEAPKPEESAPSTESSDAAEETAEAIAPAPEPGEIKEPASPQKKGAETRKQQLHAEIQELLNERARLRAEAAAAKPDENKADPSPASTDKPKAEAFTSWDEYQEALTDWKVEQKLTARETAAAEKRAQAEAATAAEKQQQQITAARAKHADFDQVVLDPSLTITPHMYQALQQLPDGAEVAYQLGKQRAEAERIAALPPLQQVLEIGRFTARLTPASAPPPKTVTSASKPPTELSAKATAPGDEAVAAVRDGDFTRYRREMNARETRKK
jgi:chorismate mutase